jgi:hypothetical protein
LWIASDGYEIFASSVCVFCGLLQTVAKVLPRPSVFFADCFRRLRVFCRVRLCFLWIASDGCEFFAASVCVFCGLLQTVAKVLWQPSVSPAIYVRRLQRFFGSRLFPRRFMSDGCKGFSAAVCFLGDLCQTVVKILPHPSVPPSAFYCDTLIFLLRRLNLLISRYHNLAFLQRHLDLT